MSNFELYGELLTASVDDRTLSYRLLPFGEEGSTSIGRVVASKGTITIPTDLKNLVVNEEHDFKKPIGRIVSLEETDQGLNATVSIARTSAGNDALELAASGLRAGISVEIADPIVRNGKLLGGNLTGAGLVVRSAFPSAQLVASDCGDLTPTKENNMENISNENLEAASAETAPVVSQPAPVLNAAHSNKVDLGALVFEGAKSGAPALQAALADQLTTSDAGKVYLRDQELGEVWEARKAERPLTNAIQNKTLTSLTVSGNKKNRTFVVADWAGNKAELPTSTYSTELVTKNASALAGAVDIAMELVEFGSSDIIADLLESAMESYVTKSEAKVRAALLAGATAVDPVSVVPGWDGVATPAALFAIVDDAAKRLGLIGARISHISISSDLYSSLINLPASDAPWWLQNQGSIDLGNRGSNAGGISFSVDSTLADGSVLVFDSRAATFFESKTFTYKALDVAHGGVDFSVIKFYAVLVNDSASILKYIY
jgi:hypothetical protein